MLNISVTFGGFDIFNSGSDLAERKEEGSSDNYNTKDINNINDFIFLFEILYNLFDY